MKLVKMMLVGLIALPLSAFALDISPGSEVLSGNQTSQSEIDTAIAGTIGTATELYKQDVGGGESGSLSGSYETTFSNTPTDPSDATITYVGGDIVGPTAYLLVKDGNQEPAWYLFNLTDLGWDGMETLNLSGFWPNGGAISHVSLYGNGETPTTETPTTETPTTETPTTETAAEPGQVALLGAGLLLIGLMRRRNRTAA